MYFQCQALFIPYQQGLCHDAIHVVYITVYYYVIIGAGWNEHVSKEFNHVLHWHRLYLQHGRPKSGLIFEMQKFT